MAEKKDLELEEMDKVAGGVAQVVGITLPCTHTVVSGESLWAIAKKYYGNGAKWSKIYEANKKVIGDNPDLIKPGMKLTIPA